MGDIVKLSEHELETAEILQECLAKRLTNRQAAELLTLSARQVQRLKKLFQRQGAKALASKKRGRPSNNQLSPATVGRAQELLHGRYAGFGPTLAHEKLFETHAWILSRETVRQLMIGEGLWKPQRAKRAVMHPLRERRAPRGELVQIDGSPFAGLEARAATCTLLVFIDESSAHALAKIRTSAEIE